MRRAALVSAASGIGDIIRITPLIRVFHGLGYEVDVLLTPDYLETVELIEGAPEVRRVFFVSSGWCRHRASRLDGIRRTRYAVATLSALSLPYGRYVRADRVLAFEPGQWRQEGDLACVRAIARAVGWDGALPAPFALRSDRQFALAGATVALHPGCKPNWLWKRWSGFSDLAAELPSVVVVGTADDAPAQQWPAHVQSYMGKLGLRDTAALLSQCAALVSNDSGVMQLGVAVGVPTFGIFGITSPAREAFASPHMHAITKGLPCEPGCRRQPWGRRDCAYHLHCLKSLTAREVSESLRAIMPTVFRPVAANAG